MVKRKVKINKWADPPSDILTRILKHLDMNTDLTRLRGVCSSWRSALPLHQHTTYRSYIQVPSLSDGNHHRPLFLLETAFYFFSPLNPSGDGTSDSSGWVARMGQIAPNKWRLLNPLSYNRQYNRDQVNGNEYLLTDPPIVGEINLLDCRVFMLAKVLTLVDELDFNAKPISTKVVGEWDLTSSTRPLSAILVLLAPDHPAVSLSSRLLLLSPNDAQTQEHKWVEIDVLSKDNSNQKNFVVREIAYNKGIFYVFQVNGYDWRVGTVKPSNNTLVLKPFASGCVINQTLSFWSVSLVPSKSNECIYLVVHPTLYGDIQCRCYFLNEHEGASVDEFNKKSINNFEDEILFCSNYASFSIQSTILFNNSSLQDKNSMVICYMFSNDVSFKNLSVDDDYFYPNVMPKGVECLNLVKYRYYKGNLSFSIMKKKDAYNISVLDFDDDKKNDVLFFGVMPKKEKEVYRTLFFPPPSWVKWRCPSLDNVEVKLDDLPDYSSSDDYDGYYMDTVLDLYYASGSG